MAQSGVLDIGYRISVLLLHCTRLSAGQQWERTRPRLIRARHRRYGILGAPS